MAQRILVIAGALLLLFGCEQVERASSTTEACTAALEAQDTLAAGEEESVDLEEFARHATQAENPDLRDLAGRARAASAEQDVEEVERILTEAAEVCEQEGAA